MTITYEVRVTPQHEGQLPDEGGENEKPFEAEVGSVHCVHDKDQGQPYQEVRNSTEL